MKNQSTPFMHKPAMLSGKESAYQAAISDGYSAGWVSEEMKTRREAQGACGDNLKTEKKN